MKKSNKIIAIIVAIVLVASIFVVGTLADTNTATVSVSVNKNEIATGETATVTVAVTTNFPVATMSIPVFYDKTMVSVSSATATATGYDIASTTTDATATDTDKLYDNTGVDSSKYGFVLATYIAGANDTVSTIDNKTVLTFTITAKSDVSGEALVKCVTDSAKTEDNIEGMLYFGATTSGTTITSIPENVENINVTNASQSVTITSGSAELVAESGKATVVDATNKYVYGITPGDKVEDYIKVNNGSYELVANTAGYTNGTGATVNVKDVSGTVVETYTIIIFGDVDGTGTITTTDEAYVMAYNMGDTKNIIVASLVTTMAVDVDGTGTITTTDEAYVMAYNMGDKTAIPTNPYAK